jgi:hypothetical protein
VFFWYFKLIPKSSNSSSSEGIILYYIVPCRGCCEVLFFEHSRSVGVGFQIPWGRTTRVICASMGRDQFFLHN